MKILYILPSYNIYGGTPRKTLWLLEYFKENAVLYVYSDSEKEFKKFFDQTGAKIYEGNYGKNIFKHIKKILKIIDEEKIDIVHTQFVFGETLAFFIKLFRPNIKVINAFVGSLPPENRLKYKLISYFYRKFDGFIYVSNYVRKEKEGQFPILKNKISKVIYNGVEKRDIKKFDKLKLNKYSLYTTSGLTKIKNLSVLIKALNILINDKNYKNIYLYIVGDGPEKENLERLIKQFNLGKNIFLLGYKTNVGYFLKECDIYVHPAYAEGFGIAVAEAMIEAKPIIVSNAGALPELIENKKSGLVVDAFNEKEWANAIEYLIKNPEYAKQLGLNAKERAKKMFSKENFVKNYENFYKEILNEQKN